MYEPGAGYCQRVNVIFIMVLTGEQVIFFPVHYQDKKVLAGNARVHRPAFINFEAALFCRSRGDKQL